MQGSTLLVIDDDTDSLEMLKSLLGKSFRTLTAQSAEEGLKIARECQPDAILVDVQMSGMNGIEACKVIRKDPSLKLVPVIMISAYGDENCRTECFLWGADDFIAKPFSGRELIARVLAKLNWVRSQKGVDDNRVIRCGNLTLDETKMDVVVGDERIDLTVFEFNLLRYFLNNRDCLLSRQKIMADVWKNQVVASRAVDTHVYAIRKKLTASNLELDTVHGAGYILRSI